VDDFKPTKKVLICTAFMLVVIFISELITSRVELSRNNTIYALLSEEDPEKLEYNVKSLETATQDIGTSQKEEIKAIYYQYLAIKWVILCAFSYVVSCLLFRRLRKIE